ncbi:hypothetical protein [Virgisporangium aliadipatigenens]|uniref:hypothetical protein n=1 Tax=Virgisporangium aliadipatigenens TaxID=741659 RepID=UPI001942C2D9|nr:hypothetical protein [Virgisporangium aliadipatigenens]
MSGDGYAEEDYVEVVRDEPRGRTAEARRRAADARGRTPDGRGTRAADRVARRSGALGLSDVDDADRGSGVDGVRRPLGRRAEADGAERFGGRGSDVDGAARGAGRGGRGSDVDGAARAGAGRAGAVDRETWDRDGLRRTPAARRTGRATDRAADRVVDLAGDSRRRVIDLAGDRRARGTGRIDDRPVGRLRDRAGREAEELASREAARGAGRAGGLAGRDAGTSARDGGSTGRETVGRLRGRSDVERIDDRPIGRLRDRAGREAEALAGREAAGLADRTGSRMAREAGVGRLRERAEPAAARAERRTTRSRAVGSEPRPGVRNRRDVLAGDKRNATAETAVVGNLALDAVPARAAEPAPTRGGILGVVPPAPVSAPRAPFISLVLAVVVAGVFGILVINTKINENAFRLHDARANQADLDRNEERLRGEIAMLESPNSLAAAARRMGMVPAPTPAYLKLPNGQQVGVPQPAGGAAG